MITFIGNSFASRVAASLLETVQLPELITTSFKDYETLAVELATSPSKLQSINDRLEQNKLKTTLFDTAKYTRHLEEAYLQMHFRYQNDLPPEHITVAKIEDDEKSSEMNR